jgi:hypothetical protein
VPGEGWQKEDSPFPLTFQGGLMDPVTQVYTVIGYVLHGITLLFGMFVWVVMLGRGATSLAKFIYKAEEELRETLVTGQYRRDG